MLERIKEYGFTIAIAIALMLPTWLLGFYKGYSEAEQIYRSETVDKRFKQDCLRLSEDLANLREQYYKTSNDFKDTIVELLKCNHELRKKLEAQ